MAAKPDTALIAPHAALAALALVSGCASIARSEGTPAVLVHPDTASRKELADIVRAALGGAPVALADDALTDSNVLPIEHARPRDAAGRLLNGRDPGRPETFELRINGSVCELVRVSTGRHWTLRHAHCVPLSPR